RPTSEYEAGEETVELRFAVGACEMPRASQLGGGGGLGALALFDVGPGCPLRNVELELNQERHDDLLRAGQPASTQLRNGSTLLWPGPSQGIDPSESFA